MCEQKPQSGFSPTVIIMIRWNCNGIWSDTAPQKKAYRVAVPQAFIQTLSAKKGKNSRGRRVWSGNPVVLSFFADKVGYDGLYAEFGLKLPFFAFGNLLYIK
jgi:hypothetical protein